VWHQFRDALLELLRTPVGTLCLLLLALVAVGFGIWLTAARRLPAWCNGLLKWPLGDSVTPKVTLIYGSACIVAGIGLAIVALAVRILSTASTLDLAMVALAFAIASSALIVWSTVLSRRPSVRFRATFKEL
jgi:hypothetical protein